jgi:hypothetical protein
MRRLLLGLIFLVAVLLPQIPASATTEHCPSGWVRKTEISYETSMVMLKNDGLHCFKYGTETSGIIFTERGPWSSPNGKGISYFVCYKD